MSSAYAIYKGMAEDGGLFAPKSFPAVSPQMLEGMLKASYRERANALLSLYLTDFSAEEI